MKANIDFNADHFALFGLPRAFRIDIEALDRHYREMQAHVHPDRFADADETQRRLSLQWTTQVNEAYRTLRKPLSRALYLLELLGCAVDTENNNAMPAEFLVEQMEWREAVAEARAAGDAEALEAQDGRLRERIARAYEELAAQFDDRQNYAVAADTALRLMFLEKLLAEIDEALAALDA